MGREDCREKNASRLYIYICLQSDCVDHLNMLLLNVINNFITSRAQTLSRIELAFCESLVANTLQVLYENHLL